MRILGSSAFFDLIGPPGPQGDPGPIANWDLIPDKPTEFPPAPHQQDIDSIVGLRDTITPLEARMFSVEAAQIDSASVQAGVVSLMRADGTSIPLPVIEKPAPSAEETGWVVSVSTGTLTIHAMPTVPEPMATVDGKTIRIEAYNG